MDVDNYYVVGASALEERVDLFRVVNAKKERIWGTDANVTLDHWHVLEVEAKQDQFTISFDRNWLFTAGIARCRARDRLDCGRKRTTSHALIGSRSRLSRRRNAVVVLSEVSVGK